jgi:general secretion pathway protein C
MAFAPILERGLFGKATEGKLSPIAQKKSEDAGDAGSTADLQLLGTVVGSYRESFAFIQKVPTKEERVYRLGEKVYDLGPLVGVKKDSVEISVGGRRVTLLVPTAVPSEGGSTGPQSRNDGLVRQSAGNSYVISQRALYAALDNISQAMTDARLVPSMKDGKVEGFKVLEIKPSGIFSMVGLRNGDTLLRINDFNINSPESAVQTLASLKGLNRIKVDLLRDGQPTTLTYDIR